MKDFITLVQEEYRIKGKPITTRNPQANSIIERAHQIIGYFLCAFEPGTAKLDPDDPWGGILSSVMFAIWSTMHTTPKATPMQLLFGRDAMLNIMHLANWCFTPECWQNVIKKNTK
eukprot:15327800-Ditylum_brightwellii.AAC.1